MKNWNYFSMSFLASRFYGYLVFNLSKANKKITKKLK
jgi:hypothetical protein